VFDLDAYLDRIGLEGRPDLAELHRAHVAAIPFENLDPHRGVPVSLAPDDLERKLVRERRGGYCFEQNLLLKAALEALGAQVELLLARVRYNAPAGSVRPRTHLVLRVAAGDVTWHADAGFGAGTLLEPSRSAPARSTSSPAGASASSRTATSWSCRRRTGRAGSTSTRSSRGRFR
jgi:N-hydroxyarylamine O-acetyltransferase